MFTIFDRVVSCIQEKKKFLEEHREAITIYKAAKEAFSQIEGTIPKIRKLNAEYERVLREKKETYAEYRKAQQEMKEPQIAKHNVEQLKKEEQEHQDRQKKKDNPLLQFQFGVVAVMVTVPSFFIFIGNPNDTEMWRAAPSEDEVLRGLGAEPPTSKSCPVYTDTLLASFLQLYRIW